METSPTSTSPSPSFKCSRQVEAASSPKRHDECDLTVRKQATNAVVTLFATWAFGIAPPNMKVLGNVGIIVLGVVIASFGEIKFDLVGFLCT